MEAAGEVAELLQRLRQLVRRRDEQRASPPPASRAASRCRAAARSRPRRAAAARRRGGCARGAGASRRRCGRCGRATRAGRSAPARSRSPAPRGRRSSEGGSPLPAANTSPCERVATSAPTSDALTISGAATADDSIGSSLPSCERDAMPVSSTVSTAPPGVGRWSDPGSTGVQSLFQPATTTSSFRSLSGRDELHCSTPRTAGRPPR